MIGRHLTEKVLAALADTPVVLLSGARQTGKTTLVKWLSLRKHPARYLILDDPAVLAAAQADPTGFVESLDGPVILDEIQRAPELFRAIKLSVDRRRTPGRFLLTGSANILLLPRLSESLAGRMEILTLWPLSQGETEGLREGFIDAILEDELPRLVSPREDRRTIIGKALRGGFPEVVRRITETRRRAWFQSYIATILQRDVRDLSNIESLAAMPRLLSLLAARATALLNLSEISRSLGMPLTTLNRYMALFEATFLVHTVPAWSGNLRKRLIKSPKLILCDSGLTAHLAGLTAERIAESPDLAGPLLESFVILELKKQSAWSTTQTEVFHFRSTTRQEVDILLEDSSGRLVGIEVKAASTVTERDFKGLTALAEAAGKRFHRGVLLYTGTEALPFGPRLHALPLTALWRLGAKKVRAAERAQEPV